jgi:DNA-binding LacI/PurR family transcriptional regulator
MAITIVDIANKLDISHATVSRVLNGRKKSYISERTYQRVLDTAMEMGYRPNRMARALATGTSYLVAVTLPNLSSPIYGQIINSLQTCMKRDGFDMIPATNEDSGSLCGWPVDGILAFCGVERIALLPEDCGAASVPVVRLAWEGEPCGDFVRIDLHQASRHAVEHLLQTGRKRVAYVVYDLQNVRGCSRRDAYVDVMSEAGLEPEIILLPDLARSTARRMVGEYVERNGSPDGLFCMNDDYAIGAYRALRDFGMRIPEDVGLVGCDGIEDTEYMDAPISTIVQPVEEMCELSWRFLCNRMADPEIPTQRAVLQSRLEIRGSSDYTPEREG